MIEGDSASSTELYALLSSLSDLAIRQDIAVTGSVNQRGQVQAIGGVNHKIEGFYDICRLQGWTKKQGVMIPQTNVRHLMLREDVVEAVKKGEFHIYAVSTIDEGISLLTGIEAGERDKDGNFSPDTVHGKVQARLEELAHKAKEFSEKNGKNAK
jgi:predicted ATP-dependent protease